MVKGALAIIKFGDQTYLAIYRGRHSEFYKNKKARLTNSFGGEDPLIFTEQREDGSWITRHYFFEKKDIELSIEWLT